MEKPAASGFGQTQTCRQSDVEGGRSLAILAPGNGIDPRLVGRARTTSAFGDVQADAGRSAQRLIPQAALRNCGFAHSIEQLSRLLVSMQFLKRKTSNELESLERSAPKAQVFLSQPAGASDNAEGVGTRLLLPLPVASPFSAPDLI